MDPAANTSPAKAKKPCKSCKNESAARSFSCVRGPVATTSVLVIFSGASKSQQNAGRNQGSRKHFPMKRLGRARIFFLTFYGGGATMTIYRKIAAVFLGCLLSSGSAFADWQIQAQGKDGSWRGVKTGLPTEKHARYEAKIACIRSKSPLKIIETDTGKEYKLYCDPKTGRISDNDKPAPVVLLTEPQASERAKLVKKQCLGNYFMQSMLDCGCIENKAKAELLQSEARISPDAILRKVSNPPVNKACINRTGIYQYTHDSCVSVMKTPTDVEKFCGCTADVTVAGFVKDPTLNNYHYEKLRDAAMRQCGLGKSNRRIPAS